MRVLVTGAGGQFGHDLVRHCVASGDDVVALERTALDVGDRDAVAAALDRHRPEVVVNAAAWTAVDACERDVARAFRDNADAVRYLREACDRRSAHLVQISTDYVFDGTATRPYREDDPIAPLGVYGASKAEGEQAVHEAGGTVVRTSWLFAEGGPSFVHTMLRLAKERPVLRVVADQHGRPTLTRDLADAIVRIAQRLQLGAPIAWGTYHFASAGRASWCDVARQIVELQAPYTGRKPPVDAISTDEYPTPAKRPRNSELDTSKLERALALSPAPWQVGMTALVSELLAGTTPEPKPA